MGKRKIRWKADEFNRRAKKRNRAMIKPDSKSCCYFEKIPEDLSMEILSRLPGKLATRFKCVSKRWYSLISSRVFINFFLRTPSSAKRPRLLYSIVDNADQTKYIFLSSLPSSSPLEHPDTSVCALALDQTPDMPGMGGYFVNALRGLLCVRLGRSVRICKLTTKQRVTLPLIKSTLPLIKSRLLAKDNIWSYFGHEPIHDEYKLLSTVWVVDEEQRVRSEHRVLVLGPGASWRSPQSRTLPPPPHRPYSQGISINGVLYYGAWTDANTCVLMSFDLSSEEFNLIQLPVEAGIFWHTSRTTLVNYRGKLAVLEYSGLAFDASVHLWVMKNAKKSNWSTNSLVFPLSQMNFVRGDQLSIQGTSRCGEVRLSKTKFMYGEPSRSVIYDMEKNRIIRSLDIIAQFYRCFVGEHNGMQINLWEDDNENIMFLET